MFAVLLKVAWLTASVINTSIMSRLGKVAPWPVYDPGERYVTDRHMWAVLDNHSRTLGVSMHYTDPSSASISFADGRHGTLDGVSCHVKDYGQRCHGEDKCGTPYYQRQLCAGQLHTNVSVGVRMKIDFPTPQSAASWRQKSQVLAVMLNQLNRAGRLLDQGNETHENRLHVLIKRYGWSILCAPQMAFVAIVNAEPSMRTGFRGLPTCSYVDLAEQVAGAPLQDYIKSTQVPFCSMLGSILQVALKIRMLQLRSGFIHGDLNTCNILCTNISASRPEQHTLIGNCTFIDFESSVISVPGNGIHQPYVLGLLKPGRLGSYFMSHEPFPASSPVFAMDLHWFFFELRRDVFSVINSTHAEHLPQRRLAEWLATYAEDACEDTQRFGRYDSPVTLPTNYVYRRSGLDDCFRPENVIAYIHKQLPHPECMDA